MNDAKMATVSLSWFDHPRAFLQGLWDFFLEKRKVDVEIVYGNERVAAHQLVLSIFSTHFREKLDACGGQFARLDLSQVIGGDVEFDRVVEFLYKGKVDVGAQRLPRVKELAVALGIQGLVDAIQRQENAESTGFERRDERETDDPDRPPGDHGARRRKGRPVKIPNAGDEILPDARRIGVAQNESREAAEPPLANDGREGTIGTEPFPDDGRRRVPLPRKASGRTEPGGQRFPCELCDKSFRNKAGLRCHLRRHGDPDLLHRCPRCPFRTPKKSSWVKHLAVIHRIDPQGNEVLRNVACPDCDYTCVDDYQLKAHRTWKHAAAKPHKCPECSYAAVMKCEVDKHVRIKHRNERPFMCETCGYRGQTHSGLVRHKRSHTGIKPFRCDLCGQAYADNRKLKSHLLRHAGDDKPFVCHLCGHACRRRDNLQVHLKRIHKTTLEGTVPPSSETPGSTSTERPTSQRPF